jgi:catechol 2,3-dioxygenase-like lactoylglutathione lyase family enzyme
MPDPNFLLFYVESAEASAAFYKALLDRQPAQASPNFALFVLPSGLRLGLWSWRDVRPATTAARGGAELVFTAKDAAAVETTCADWRGRGLRISQEPESMDFGRTFVALDPDGHRLRVFAPGQESSSA